MTAGRRTGFRGLFVAGAAALLATQAGAAETSRAALIGSPEFATIMRTPGDVEAVYGFARLAIARGEPSLAIAALERLARLRPANGAVRLDLADLYAAAGNDAQALYYLDAARKAGGLDPKLVARADRQAAALAQRMVRHRFSGRIEAGAGFDTNANAAPLGDRLTLFSTSTGELEAFTSSAREEAAVSAIVSGALTYETDLDASGRVVLQVGATGYAEVFRDVADQDIYEVQVDVGPWLLPGDGGGVALRPFAVGGAAWITDEFYVGYVGGGLEAALALGPRTTLHGSVTGAWRRFVDSDVSPLADDQSGVNLAGAFSLVHRFGGGVTVVAGATVARQTARKEVERYMLYAARLGAEAEIAPLSRALGRKVTGALNLSLEHFDHDGGDPVINPGEPRADTVAAAGAALSVALDDNLSVIGDARYIRRMSRYDVYDYESFKMTWRLSYGF